MFKYLKYELKGSYKLPLGLLIIMTLWCAVLYTKIGTWSAMTISVLCTLTAFGTSLITFIYVIYLYKQDFSEERGYLTFTLPLSGKSIVGAKLLLSFIWLSVITLGSMAFTIIILNGLNALNNNIPITLTEKSKFIALLIGNLYFIIIIFMAITLSKVAFKNKKIGGISFLVFILLNSSLFFLNIGLIKLFPQGIELNTGKIVNMLDINLGYSVLTSIKTPGNPELVYLNIASIIYYAALIVGLFIFNAYLIDKKLDL